MRLALSVAVFIVAVSAFTGVVADSTILSTVTLPATATIVPTELAEDVDGDGCVTESDLAIVGRNLDLVTPSPPGADVNNDGIVDVIDVALVAVALGSGALGANSCS